MTEDEVFDHQLPQRVLVKSSLHFTPVAVARMAARLLAPRPEMRVLDVGSGVGKLCMVAAREVPSCTFVGIELRPHLVHLARKLATRLAVTNVQFIEGDALDLDWSGYDAFYFYNPFAEQLHDTPSHIDRTLRFGASRFDAYVGGVCTRLLAAPPGTRVVTYHSLGAAVPFGYDLVEDHLVGTDRLELWIKRRDATTGAV